MKMKTKMKRVEDGVLLPVSSGRRGECFQDALAQTATWPPQRRLSFVYVSRRLPLLGEQRVVLASLI